MRTSGLICPAGLVLSAVAGIVASAGLAQSLTTQAEMHARIRSLYNFSPSKVTDEIRASKSDQMDSFWTDVKNQRATALPLLRKELEDPTNPRFFFADGSALLLSLSHAPEDQKIAVAALARIDLSDFQSHEYLFQVHALAVRGADVSAAALHMLDDPKFEVFLPEHGAYRLDQGACLLEALLPLPVDLWLPAVIKRARTEHDETAIKSLIVVLFYAQTDAADEEIKKIAGDSGYAKEIRDRAAKTLQHERALGVGKEPSPKNEAKLRRDRQARMAAVSDEAMDDMDELTGKIARARTIVQ